MPFRPVSDFLFGVDLQKLRLQVRSFAGLSEGVIFGKLPCFANDSFGPRVVPHGLSCLCDKHTQGQDNHVQGSCQILSIAQTCLLYMFASTIYIYIDRYIS